jgi:hypothetical protein
MYPNRGDYQVQVCLDWDQPMPYKFIGYYDQKVGVFGWLSLFSMPMPHYQL